MRHRRVKHLHHLHFLALLLQLLILSDVTHKHEKTLLVVIHKGLLAYQVEFFRALFKFALLQLAFLFSYFAAKDSSDYKVSILVEKAPD